MVYLEKLVIVIKTGRRIRSDINFPMNESQNNPQRILIASANPLFSKGLEKLLHQRQLKDAPDIRIVENLKVTMELLEDWKPSLVIVDYDDQVINRENFLNIFVASEHPMQALLVSLNSSGSVIVYDRRILTANQAEEWLNLPWLS
jgi:cytochrome c oxidase subunit II